MRSLSGAAQEMQVRIIDAALPNAVQEIYTGSDNLGAAVNAAFKPSFKTEFVFEDFKDGVRTEAVEYGVLPHEKDYYINCGLYDENGNLLKPYRKPESRMSGVTVIADPEGMDKLATLQTVSGTGSEDTLAKIAAEWEYDGGWQLKDRELYTQIVQNGEFRRNLVFGNGNIHSQKHCSRSVNRHGSTYLIQRDAFKQSFHIGKGIDSNAYLANFAVAQFMVAVKANLRRKSIATERPVCPASSRYL